MKVIEEVRNLEVSGDFERADYTIAANPMAFRILFNNIYSDKVTAIIRELGTNAFDSHVAAGKPDYPFKVHLPNSLEPYFAVIDEGVGMSDDFVRTQYNRFFLSDKQHTNDQTGCMGLGSKSPFAYTDSYTVISRYNGVETTYNPIITDKAVPSVVKLHSVPTDKCNGVEVRFSVKTGDFYEFQNKAKEVLSWFKTQPEVVGAANFKLNQRTYLRQTDRYGVAKDRNYQSHVVMGNVAYRIDANDFRASKSELTDLERQVLDWGADLFVSIGTVQVTPSRETLSYDPQTAATIKQHLSEVIKDIEVEVEKQIAQAPTLWQARRALHDAKFSILGRIRELDAIKWRGQDLTVSIPIKPTDPNAPLVYQLSRRKQKYMNDRVQQIHADDIPKFVNNLPHGGRAAAVRWLTEKGLEKAYLIEDNDANKAIVKARTGNKGGISQDLGKFLSETGLGEVVQLTSSVPKAERQKRAYAPRSAGCKATLSQLQHCDSHLAAAYWVPADVEMRDGGVYLEISHYYCLKKVAGSEDKTFHPKQLEKFLSLLTHLGDKTPVYGVRPADVERLQKHGRWIHFDTFLKEILEKNKGLVEQVKLIKEHQSIGSDCQRVVQLVEKAGFSDTSPFGQLAAIVKEAYKATQNQKANAFMRLCEHFGVHQVKETDSLSKAKAKVFALYPLLNHISWWQTHDAKFVSAIVDYVNAMDGQRVLNEYINRQKVG